MCQLEYNKCTEFCQIKFFEKVKIYIFLILILFIIAKRTQKRRVLTAEATGDEERLLTSQVKYRRLNEEYERFSKGVGLRTQTERMYVEGFTPKHGKAATKAAKNTIRAGASQ